jgi:predicted membrane protein
MAAVAIVHGFETNFLEMGLAALILVWIFFVLAWFFPGTVGRGYYNFLVEIRVTFTHAALLLYSSIGTTLEIAMIAHGIYRGKKSEEYEPEETN